MALRLAIVFWAGLVAAGFFAWEAFDAAPGSIGPIGAADRTPTGRGSLVVFLHPHCPCSRATLAELAALPRGADVQVVFVRPGGTPADWEHGEALRMASELPGVAVRTEVGEDEAHRNGAATSGHAVARDAAGTVVFRGGITPGRGRRGDNPGVRAVAAVLRGEAPAVAEWPVFGCPLFAPGAAPACCQNPNRCENAP